MFGSAESEKQKDLNVIQYLRNMYSAWLFGVPGPGEGLQKPPPSINPKVLTLLS